MKYYEKPPRLDIDQQLDSTYEEILREIDTVVEGCLVYTTPYDKRKIRAHYSLAILRKKMDELIEGSKKRYEVNREVNRRLKRMSVEFNCDACGSEVETSTAILKDTCINSPDDLFLLEKINRFLGMEMQQIIYCTNPKCHKIWKNDEFNKQVVEKKLERIRYDLKCAVIKDWGLPRDI